MIFKASNWDGITGALKSGLAHCEIAEPQTASRFAPYIAWFSEGRSEILEAFVIADSEHVNLVVFVTNTMLDVEWQAREILTTSVARADAFNFSIVTEDPSGTYALEVSARTNAGEGFTWHSNDGADKEEMRLFGLALSDWIASR